jgi:hypothetical protein
MDDLVNHYVRATVELPHADPERLLLDRTYARAFDRQQQQILTEARQRIRQTRRFSHCRHEELASAAPAVLR